MQKTASKSSMLRLGVPLSLVEFQQMTQSKTAKVKSVSADFVWELWMMKSKLKV